MANLLDEPVHPEPALVILDHAPMHLKEDTKEEPKPEPEFAPFVQAIPDNLNGWLEWEGEELEEDEMEVDVEEEIDVVAAPVGRSTLQLLPLIHRSSGTFYLEEGSSATAFSLLITVKFLHLDLWEGIVMLFTPRVGFGIERADSEQF
nr:hypothetical protein [Tanacetum cinerariifolium]